MSFWLTATLATLAIIPLVCAAVMAVLNVRDEIDVERVVFEDIVHLERLIKAANAGDSSAQSEAAMFLNRIIVDYESETLSRLDTERDGTVVVHEGRIQPQA